MAQSIIVATLSALLVIVGWVVGHRLNLQRDMAAKRRELRVKYLLEAYQRLEDASNRSAQDLPEAMRAFESAVAEIQLLGTRAQIDALLEYLRQHVNNGGATIDPVLKLLRDDLRAELGLDPNVAQIHQFRFKRSA